MCYVATKEYTLLSNDIALKFKIQFIVYSNYIIQQIILNNIYTHIRRYLPNKWLLQKL